MYIYIYIYVNILIFKIKNIYESAVCELDIRENKVYI